MGKNINQLVPDFKNNLKGFLQDLADDVEQKATELTPEGETRYAKTQWTQTKSADGNTITVGNKTDYLVYPELGTVDQPAQLFTKRAKDIETSKRRVVKK